MSRGINSRQNQDDHLHTSTVPKCAIMIQTFIILKYLYKVAWVLSSLLYWVINQDHTTQRNIFTVIRVSLGLECIIPLRSKLLSICLKNKCTCLN